MGLKAADKDIFELKYVVEESKIYGTLEELKGAMDSHIENSGHCRIEVNLKLIGDSMNQLNYWDSRAL